MSPRSPTLLVPLGSLGEATLTRIDKTLGADREQVRTWRPADGEQVLKDLLSALLRVGSSPRLDVLVFADGIERTPPLAAAVIAVSHVIATHFGAIFPASAPIEQRSAGIQVLVYTPPLTDNPGARAVLGALAELDQAELPHPTLARVWLAASQTRAGVLSAEDLVSQGTGFGLAVLGAGIRESDAVERRLGHVGEGRIGFVSVGTLDLPLGRVEAWARVRAGYTALAALVERVAPAAGRMRGLEPEVVDRWLAPFEGGPEAEALKSAAWKVAGGKEIPERISLGPLDGPDAVKRRYVGLFAEPGASGRASVEVKDALVALDRRHTEVLEDLHRSVRVPFAGRLGEVRPLADLPALEYALEQVRRRLVGREESTVVRSGALQGPTVLELERAVAAMPRPGVLRMLGLATMLAVGFALLGIATAVLLRPPPAAATGMTTGVRVSGQAAGEPTTASHVVPWIVGGAGGVVAGGLVFALAGRRSRASLLELLKARADALKQARSSGLASGPSAEAADRLLHHRQRVQVAALRAVDAASDRLQLVRDALNQCRAELGQRLDGFGVPPQSVPDAEDLTPLFEVATPFHAPLLGPDATRAWVRRARRFSDAEVLADHVVDGLIPRDGLLVDIPASDPEQVLERASAQTRALLETSLFDDEQAAKDIASRAEAFARSVVRSLAPGCAPIRDDGMPATGLRPGATFVVGPADGRHVLEDALARSQTGIGEQYWTQNGAPLVLVVRTWEGYTLQQLTRGVLG